MAWTPLAALADQGFVTDRAAPLPPGLWSFRQAWTWRQFEQVPIVFVGASTFNGAAVTSPDFAVPEMVGAILRANDRTPSSQRGGMHIRSDHPGWTTTGTLTDYPRDLGANVKELAAAATAQYAHVCDGYELMYLQGSTVGTSMTYQTDAAAGVAVTPNVLGTDTATGITKVTGLTRASHTVKVTATTGITRLSGIYFTDGDATAGVRTYNAGKAGAKASWFSGLSVDVSTNYGARSNAARIGELNPKLVVVGLGANDYSAQTDLATYELNLRAIVKLVRLSVNRPCSVLLVQQQERQDVVSPVITWAEYGAVLAQIAADTADVDFLDVSGHFPQALAYDWDGMLDSAGVHPTNRGSAWMAEIIADHLLRAVAPLTIPTQQQPTAVADPDPSTISGLKSAWRASDLAGADSSAVASWSAYAGSDQKPLAQTTALRQPILRTASSTFRNQKCVIFDGATTNGDMMTCSWTTPIPPPATVCLVARLLGHWGTVFSGFSGTVGTGGKYLGILAAAGEQVMLLAAGSTAAPYGFTCQIGRNRWGVIIARFAANTAALFQTGQDQQTFAMDITNANAGFNPGFTLGGSSAANAGAEPMEVAELAVYNRALSDAECAGVLRFWERKYDLDWIGRGEP
jgi:lysophospholipase L1-like esterase